jgi:aquaporin Z
MVMVYMGGHISGAHYNPAVSVAILIRGKMEARDLIPYVLSQLTGAILASLTVMFIVGDTFAPAPAPEAGLVLVLLCEVLFTFALALVVLNVATDDATAGNSYYGLAIGFTVMVGAFAVGAVSGGVFNPAVGTGPILIDVIAGDGVFTHLWIYWAGPLLGGVAAAGVFDLQHAE